MRLLIGGGLVLLSALPARAAETDQPPPQEKATLRWVRSERAASCPSEADVARAIEQRVGPGVLVAKDDASLVVEAELDGLPSGQFRVEISLFRGQEVVGRRELESEDASCLNVAEAAALVIALTIDPEASLGALPIAAAPRPTPADLPPPERAPPTRRQSAPVPVVASPDRAREPAPWQAELELALGIATGIVPKVASGAQARARVLPPGLPFGIELGAAYFPARKLEAPSGKGANFTVFHAGAGLCSRVPRSALVGAMLCVGGSLGKVTGRGYNLDVTPAFQTWTFALAARGAVALRIRPPFSVVVGASLAVPLKRDHFEVETSSGTTEVFRLARLGVGFDLGVVWEL